MNSSSLGGTPFAPAPDPNRTLPEKAGQTTPENPWPLRLLSQKMQDYIARMPSLWVEAEVLEYKPRPGTRMSFFLVSDSTADVSINVTAFPTVVDAAGPGFEAGARVVMEVKPNFWEARGSLSLRATKILIQGEGDLLAQIDRLRRQLAAEGLFRDDLKKPLPLIPRRIGLICGRNAKAKEDVLVNALALWPPARFEIREVAVQGVRAATEVTAALQELDASGAVDVIVITRGGGSVEDLLPFSEEILIRAAFACRTPIVSAIGHEEDAPLLDFVADYRASTPTDAAKRIVPSLADLLSDLSHQRTRLRGSVTRRLAFEREQLFAIVSRPVLARPGAAVERQLAGLDATTRKLHAAALRLLGKEQTVLAGLKASLRALSPQATLERGYAILRAPDGTVVDSAAQLKRGDLLEGLLAKGSFVSQVVGANPSGGLQTKDDEERINP